MSEMKIRDENVAFASFGQDVKEARKAMGITRESLAGMLNIDVRYLANIENYHQIPSLSLFYRIIVTCNLPVNRYFYEFNNDFEDEELQMFLYNMNACPKKYRGAVKALVDELRRIDNIELK